MTTYANTLSIFCQLAGLDPETLSDVDRRSFNDLFNRWLNRGWKHYPWPKLLDYEEVVADAGSVVPFDKGDVIGVYREDPLRILEPSSLRFRLVKGGVIVGTCFSKVWIGYRSPCPRFGEDNPDAEVPDYLANFTASGAYTDWLRGEGQQGKANAEGRDPWDWLYDEVDNIERTQRQTRNWRFRAG